METFTTLIQQVEHCTLCAAHLPMGARPIFQLNPKAKILLAGQAPGKRAHETGIPFNDPSGDRLRQWLGIDRTSFYDPSIFAILPMGFCYPGTGKSGDLPPRPECAPQWRMQLLDKLPNIKLSIIIGTYAVNYHFGKSKKNLSERVRQWRLLAPSQYILPHPSPRNRKWLENSPFFEADVIPHLQQQVQVIINSKE